MMRRSSQARDTKAALARAWGAFGGRRLGLVRRCAQVALDAGLPSLFVVESEVAATSVYMKADHVGGTGGIGTDAAEATLAAIGEAVERYCGAYFDPRRAIVASKDELGAAAVGLDAFAFFSETQYAYERFPFAAWRADIPIRWIEGTSLVDGRKRYVPASVVFIPYTPRDAHDELFHAVSTGQACHSDRTLALLSGLYEVLERDSLMITWLRALRVPRVDFMADEALRALWDKHVAGTGVRVHAFDMTFDFGFPSYFCIGESERRGRTVFAAGAATRGTPREAMRKALLESLHSLNYAGSLLDDSPTWRPAPQFGNVLSFRDHVRLFCEPEARDYLAFLLDSNDARPMPAHLATPTAPSDALAAAVSRVESLGLDAIVVDLTTDEVRDAGFHVPKVLIPGAVPLTAAVPAVGSPRLRSVPAKLGLRSALGEALNRTPHPFP